ncbi:MAG TPA: histidine--tRNA ligase [Candidatus Acidoferrales bacterium]|nr:histidine--tRNA ligase [Candidatus Acidoferrales bacterium]
MSSNAFTLPRGMRDTEPEEMVRRLWLYDRIREVVSRYGFRMVEPTTIENLKTLEAKSGTGIRDEIYWFKDKAGRSLGLRFDLTVGLARMIANRTDLPEPIKFATIGGNWRYDEPQFARYRYFTQWDVEIFGSESPLADAEVICVGSDILVNAGLKDFLVRISNRKLAESYLKQLGIRSDEKLEQCLRIIDKMRKESRERLSKDFTALKIKENTVEEIFSYISINGSPRAVLDRLASFDFTEPEAKRGVEELETLSDALAAYGRLDRCVYDMSIVRGIGYYDGIVFEAFDKEGEDVGSIFGGGRYDKLCKIYGKRDIPATGVAGGIERLMISLERAKLYPKTQLGAKVFLATVGEESRLEAVRVAENLRANGIAAEFDLKGRSLGKQLEYANAAKIPYLIVLGPQEIQSRMVKVKEMATGTETAVPIQGLAEKLRELD